MITHLSLVNEVRHSKKATSTISTPFQHKYPFQNPKNKISFPLHDIKSNKKYEKNQMKNRLKKSEEEEDDGV